MHHSTSSPAPVAFSPLKNPAAPSPSQPAADSTGSFPPSAAAPVCHVIRDKLAAAPGTVLELRVRNHPGTMSHITGLFARRAFNLDAIVCVPLDDGATSRMLLLVSNEPRLEQVERQLAKLYDVLEVRHRDDLDACYFHQLGRN